MEALKKLFGFGEDSIESIVSDVQSKIARLRAVANKHLSDATQKREDAKLLEDEADKHDENHRRADKIADKFTNLLSDD